MPAKNETEVHLPSFYVTQCIGASWYTGGVDKPHRHAGNTGTGTDGQDSTWLADAYRIQKAAAR